MGEKGWSELLAGLASLHHTREFADLVIFDKQSSRHPVHRAIVCPRSNFFYSAVKDGRWKEGAEGQIALPDEEPEVVRLMIEYFYLLDYNPVNPSDDRVSRGDSSDTMSVRTEAGHYGHVYGTSAVSAFGGPNSHPSSYPSAFRPRTDSGLTVHAMPTSATDFANFNSPPRRRQTSRGMVINAPEPSPLATDEPHLTLHANLYAAAQTYDIDGLKALSLDKFKIQVTRHWDSPEFPKAIRVVYNSTPNSDKDMRETVADVIGWHSALLDKPEIENVIMEINGLAYELLKRSRRAEPEYM